METTISFASLIVTYNSAGEIGNLLSDLRRPAPPDRRQIVVIDNCSSDDTVSVIRSRFPEVRLVANARNVGFARAVNQGMDLCEAEFVFLLNPDMRIAQADFHEAMLACMRQSPAIAAVGPLQFVQEGQRRRLNFSWSYYSPAAFRLFVSHRLNPGAKFTASLPVQFLNCGCLLIRRAAFLRVGRLNENYFLYGEEPDLFLKFKRWGYESRLLPTVEVVHYRDRSLNSLPMARRWAHRLRGLVNIGDALVRGYARLALGRWFWRGSG
jgi:GT2 family glycosyltransferase